MPVTSQSFPYDVALSFAGPDRTYVDAVARFLAARGTRLFYDRFEQVDLWGKDLIIHLDGVYRTNARYCVIFISRHYAASRWASHEVRSALARAFVEQHEYILPVRFDDTEIPGVRGSVAYIDARDWTPELLGALIREKLEGQTSMNPEPTASMQRRSPFVRVIAAAVFIGMLAGQTASTSRAVETINTATRLNAVAGEQFALPVSIRLRASRTGIPIVNRHVTIHRGGEVSGEYISDLFGEVRSTLAPGNYSVVVAGPGGARTAFEVSASSTSITIELLGGPGG